MKRFICAFMAFLMVSMTFISPYEEVKAAGDIMSGLTELDYLTLGEISLAISQGVELDWSGLDLGNALLSNEEKARRMLAYYRTKCMGYLATGAYAIVDWLEIPDVVEAETAAITFQASSGLTGKNISGINTQITDRSLYNTDAHILTPYNYNVVSYWNRYNKLYINEYLQKLNAEPEPVEDEPFEVPAEYQAIISTINGDGFSRLANWPQSYSTGVENGALISKPVIKNYPIEDYSVIAYTYDATKSTNWNYSKDLCICPITDINITSNGTNFYLATIECNALSGFQMWNGSSAFINSAKATFRFDLANNDVLNNQANGTASGVIWTQTISGDLSTIFNKIATSCRNVNLYVDGVLWSSATGAGTSIDSTGTITGTVPNAVIDNSTDNGKIIAHDIYWPDTGTLTDGSIDCNADLDKLANLIADKIGAGETTLDNTDAIDAGVWVDSLAVPIATAIPKSIAKALEEARAADKADDIDLADEIADTVPSLPSLPVMPLGAPGFNGVTVLARIVNFTNQSLPTLLVSTFWGVVFGVVVLGIIKMLHK